MSPALKRTLAFALCLALVCAAVPAAFGLWLEGTMPAYADSLGSDNHMEKLTGVRLARMAAEREDNVLIYGSSELRTTNISTHPSNFFADKRCGFQVDIIGRGSCQSIIHALNIAAAGSALSEACVVLITSPQSYVEGGIAPDLFLANFSKEQFYLVMDSGELSDGVKDRFALRVEELLREYGEKYGGYEGYDDVLAYVTLYNAGGAGRAALAAFAPYWSAQKCLLTLRDDWSARDLILTQGAPDAAAGSAVIDWDRERYDALAAAADMTANNDFGILSDYWNTYIGTRLEQNRDKEKDLSYTESEEYGDLALLLDVCRELGVEPMFVHVPLNGLWSDHTGFAPERRQQYYDKVRGLVEQYPNVTLLDLTGEEYTPYFLCDVMHLGWNGWLSFDEALIDFYQHRLGKAA